MKKRLYEIDLLKVISCFMVVCIHVDYFGTTRNSFIYGFLRCCIPIFYMCSGFLMFRKEATIKDTYKKMFKSIILPSFITYLFLYLFDSFITGGNNYVIANLKNIPYGNFNMILYGVKHLSLTYVIDSAFSLWYMDTMVVIYISYPLLRKICKNEHRINKIRRFMMFSLFLLCFLLVDIGRIIGINFEWHSLLNPYYFFYIFLGYEFYVCFFNREKDRKLFRYGLLAYFSGVMFVAFFKAFGFLDVHTCPTFDYNNIGVLISAIGLFIACMNYSIKNTKVQETISFIGIHGLLMYLVHQPVVLILRHRLIFLRFENFIYLQYVLHVLIAYFITLFISICLKKCIILIKKRVEHFIHG